MKEIKFRCWDAYGSVTIDEPVMDYYSFEEGNMWILNELEHDQINRLQQYTGLKDKNGVEIYEGDIMKVHDEVGVVSYDENNVCYEIEVDCGHNPCIGRYEVIGNIYENPELLEDK